MAKNNIDVVVKGDYTDKDIQRAIKDLEKIQASSQGLEGRMKKLGGSVQEFGGKVSAVGGKLTAGVTLPMVAAGGALVAFAKGAEDAEIANRKLGAVLDSMGYPEAAERVSAYAEELERSLAIDADVIKATQTKLATFKNLTATVGDAGGAFDRATLAALDLAAAGFGSAESNAVQLGKALQDPVKGISALARAGVTFTEQEKAKIKTLVESGDVLSAQNMILQSIESQVGGTAEAGASAFDRIKLSLMQVADTIGAAVLPKIQELADYIANTLVPMVVPKIERFISMFDNLDPNVKKAIGVFAGFAAALGPVLLIVGKVITSVGAIIGVFNPLSLKIALVVAAVVAVVAAFKAMWDRSQALREAVRSLIATVQNIARVLWDDLLAAFKSVTGAGGSVRDIFDRVAKVAGDVLAGALRLLSNWWNILANGVRVAIKVFEVIFKAIQMVATIIRGAIILAIDVLMNRLGPVSTALRNFAKGVKDGFSIVANAVISLFNNIGPGVEKFINFAIRGVNKLIDAYNSLEGKIPGVTRVAHVAEFQFQALSISVEEVGKQTSAAAGAMNASNAELLRMENNADRTADTTDDLNDGLDDLNTNLDTTGSAADKASEKTKKFEERLKKLRGALDSAIEKSREYSRSVSDQLVGFLNLGQAYEDYTARQQAVTTTLAELTKFQTEIQGDATDEQKKKLQELQKAYQDAQAAAANGAQSIVDEFIQQGERIGKFSENLQTLLKAGLSKNAFDAILREGVDRGADIAAALVQGNVAENARRVSEVYDSVRIMGDQVGAQASTNFMSQGIIMAQAMLTGFIREFMPSGKKRRNLLDAINGMVDEAMAAMGRMTNVSMPTMSIASASVPVVQAAPVAMAPDGIFAPGTQLNIFEGLAGAMGVPMFAQGGLVTGPTFGLLGEAGPEVVVPLDRMGQMGGTTINLTVNAGMGTNGPEVGRQIVDALKAYERRNGAVYVSA